MKKCLLFIFILLCSLVNQVHTEDLFSAFQNFQNADEEAKEELTQHKNLGSKSNNLNNLRAYAMKQFNSQSSQGTIQNHIKRVVNGEVVYEEKNGVVLIDKTKNSPNKKIVQTKKPSNLVKNSSPKKTLNLTPRKSSGSPNKNQSPSVHTYKAKVIQVSVRQNVQDINQQREIKASAIYDSIQVEDIKQEIIWAKAQKDKVQKEYLGLREKLAAVDSNIEQVQEQMLQNNQKKKLEKDEARKRRLENLESSYKKELQGYKDEKQKIENQKLQLKKKHYAFDDQIKALTKMVLDSVETKNVIKLDAQKIKNDVNNQIQRNREIDQREIDKQAQILADIQQKNLQQKNLEEIAKREAAAKQERDRLNELIKKKEDDERQLKELQRQQEEAQRRKREQEQKDRIEAQRLEMQKKEQKMTEDFLKAKQQKIDLQKQLDAERNKAAANKKQAVLGTEDTVDKSKYRPIKIIYDQQFLEQELLKIAQKNQIGKKNQSTNQIVQDFKNKVKRLLQHCDQVFKKYLWVPIDTEQNIRVSKNFYGCKASNNASSNAFNYDSSNFKQDQLYKADLVIYFTAYYEEKTKVKNQNDEIVLVKNTVNASALPCKVSVFEQPNGVGYKRTTIGRINFNLFNMDLTTEDEYKYSQYVNTSVHELFHVIAFHEIIFQEFERFVDSQNYPHLYALKRNIDKGNEHPMQDGHAHWKEYAVPVDVMAPTSSRFKGLSIFSLEYIDLANKLMVTDRSIMPDNFYTKHLNYKENFLDYKCVDTESSKNPYFCSLLDKEENPFGCSVDYKMKIACSELGSGDGKYKNNCFPISPQGGNNKEDSNAYCTNVSAIVDDKNAAEVFGQDSRCFVLKPGYGSLCLQFDIQGTDLYIKMQDQKVKCDQDNQFVNIKYFLPNKPGTYIPYTIKCPVISDFISTFERTNCPNECYFNGFCINSKCDCFAGWDPAQHCRTHKPNTPGAFSTFTG